MIFQHSSLALSLGVLMTSTCHGLDAPKHTSLRGTASSYSSTASAVPQVCTVTLTNGTQVPAETFAQDTLGVEFDAVSNTLTCSERNVCTRITVKNCHALDCSGDDTCPSVIANNVENVTCEGNGACYSATLNYPKHVECWGPAGCTSAKLNHPQYVQCSGGFACSDTEVTLPHFASMFCDGADSCNYSFIASYGSGEGVELSCSKKACYRVFVQNVDTVQCLGDHACEGNSAEFKETNLLNAKQVTCSGPRACANADVSLQNFASMQCFDGGCEQTEVTHSKTGEGVDLLCEGDGSTCAGTFDVGEGTIRCHNSNGHASSGSTCDGSGTFTANCLQCLSDDSRGVGCQFTSSSLNFTESCETERIPYFFGQCPTDSPTEAPTGEPTTNSPTAVPSGEPTTNSPTAAPTGEPTTPPTPHQECTVTLTNGTQVPTETFAQNTPGVEFDAVSNTLTCSESNVCSNVTVEHCMALNCAGDDTCPFVTAKNVGNVTCEGNSACYSAKLNDSKHVECGGPASCASAKLNHPQDVFCHGKFACFNTEVTLPHFAYMMCAGADSCYNSHIASNGTGELWCNNQACNSLFVQNVDTVVCLGDRACEGNSSVSGKTLLENTKEVICSGERACANADVSLQNYASMQCSFGGCEQTTVTHSETGEGVDFLCQSDDERTCNGQVDVGLGTIRCQNNGEANSGFPCNGNGRFTANCFQCLSDESCGAGCQFTSTSFQYTESCETEHSPQSFGQCPTDSPTSDPSGDSSTSSAVSFYLLQ